MKISSLVIDSFRYSSGNSTPNHSIHTNSPPAPFSTFGYNRKDKDSNKFKAEAKIEMHHDKSLTPKYDKRCDFLHYFHKC